MAGIAIALLWLLIGAILLAGVIWLVIYGIEQFITPIPERLKQGVWFIFLLLIIIYAITAFMGGGVRIPFDNQSQVDELPPAEPFNPKVCKGC